MSLIDFVRVSVFYFQNATITYYTGQVAALLRNDLHFQSWC